MTSEEQSFHDRNCSYTAKRRIQNDKIDREQRVAISCVAAYIILGFLSFGYAWNHPSEYDLNCEKPEVFCPVGIRGIKSVAAGVFWPIWGTGTFAIAVTRWP